ncbi:MAG: nitroreductase/quinone reductase family protein [Acidimicrobiales bacterium]
MSVLGHLNHLASTRLDRISRAAARFHARRHAQGKGKLLDRFIGAPVFSLTVAGRKSGQPRTVMLILTRRGDDIIVAGSNGGNPDPPAWYLNLRDAGEATVEVGGERWAVTARHAEGAERDECWQLLVATYPDFETYQRLTDRQIPVVVLERASDSAVRGAGAGL